MHHHGCLFFYNLDYFLDRNAIATNSNHIITSFNFTIYMSIFYYNLNTFIASSRLPGVRTAVRGFVANAALHALPLEFGMLNVNANPAIDSYVCVFYFMIFASLRLPGARSTVHCLCTHMSHFGPLSGSETWGLMLNFLSQISFFMTPSLHSIQLHQLFFKLFQLLRIFTSDSTLLSQHPCRIRIVSDFYNCLLICIKSPYYP